MTVAAAVNSNNEISHQPCPFEACGSSDAFAYNLIKKVGHCHSCKRDYPSKGALFPWAESTYPMPSPKVDLRNTKVISGRYDGIRGLDEDVAKLYNIQLQYGEGGKPVRYAFKYKDNVKYRGYDEKKFWLKERGALNELFGPDFNAGSSRKLYITEGEFDAASLYQILGKSYPVKSLPSASFSEKFIKDNFEYMNSFESVVMQVS